MSRSDDIGSRELAAGGGILRIGKTRWATIVALQRYGGQSVLEVGATCRNRGANASCDPVENVVVEPVQLDPRPSIKLGPVEPDLGLIATKRAAVEEKEQLVSFPRTGSPVHCEQPPWFAVKAEFFVKFSSTRCRWRFAAFHIASGDVPGVLVGRVNEEDAFLFVDEQCTSSYARGREGLAWVRHTASVRAVLR